MTRYSYNSKPISQWPPGVDVKLTDTYLATDATDLTQSPSGTTKKFTIEELVGFLSSSFERNNILSADLGTIAPLNSVYVNGVDGVGATLTNNGALAMLSIDGFLASLGERVLVSYQANAFENGVYIVTEVGDGAAPWVMTRSDDYDNTADARICQGDYIAIIFGNDNALSWWFQTSPDVVDVGVDPIAFQKQAFALSLPWVNQTTPSVTMAVNTGYTSSAGGNLITYTLPTTCAQGSFVEITGKDAGLYTIAQTAGQVIHFGNTVTTVGVGGSISSQLPNDNIVLKCIVSDSTYTVTSSQGNFTIV